MTHKERVIASFRHQQPDRTPYVIGFTQKSLAAMEQHFGGRDFLSLIDNSVYGVAAKPGPKDHWIDENTWQDEFGVQWDRSIDRDIGNVCNRVLPDRDLSKLELPDPHDPAKFEGFAEACEAGKDRFVQFGIGFSLFERAWTMRGMDTLFMDMIEAPGFVHELLDAICDYNVALVEQAVKYEIDAVHFGDDWGSQRGLLMGPKLWEEFLKRRGQGSRKVRDDPFLRHGAGGVPAAYRDRPGLLQPIPARGHGPLRDEAPLRRPPQLLGRRQHTEAPALRNGGRGARGSSAAHCGSGQGRRVHLCSGARHPRGRETREHHGDDRDRERVTEGWGGRRGERVPEAGVHGIQLAGRRG